MDNKIKKVTATRTVEFPSLRWSIKRGETKDLPKNEEAASAIMGNMYIVPVVEKTSTVEKIDTFKKSSSAKSSKK